MKSYPFIHLKLEKDTPFQAEPPRQPGPQGFSLKRPIFSVKALGTGLPPPYKRLRRGWGCHLPHKRGLVI